MESRRAWQGVTSGIVDGNMEAVHREKCKIENHQRQLRKLERAENRLWKSRYFERAPENPMVENLGVVEKGGVWRLNDKGETLLSSKAGQS